MAGVKKILVPIPNTDFDPTEVGVPCKALLDAGHLLTFATPDGNPGAADVRMVTGDGLGIWRRLLRAFPSGRAAYEAVSKSAAFRKPIRYDDVNEGAFDALLLPGGHAKGMRPYLESKILQNATVAFFKRDKPVAAICHGTLLAARSIVAETKQSVLWGRKTTGLQRQQELTAWLLTCLWLGDYYRTYSVPMETELRSHLKNAVDYFAGPLPLRRDAPDDLSSGFTVLDGNYLSARWPGDAHKFSADFLKLLSQVNL